MSTLIRGLLLHSLVWSCVWTSLFCVIIIDTFRCRCEKRPPLAPGNFDRCCALYPDVFWPGYVFVKIVGASKGYDENNCLLLSQVLKFATSAYFFLGYSFSVPLPFRRQKCSVSYIKIFSSY